MPHCKPGVAPGYCRALHQQGVFPGAVQTALTNGQYDAGILESGSIPGYEEILPYRRSSKLGSSVSETDDSGLYALVDVFGVAKTAF